MTFRPFYRRRFLNRRGHHAGAYVLADVRINSWKSDRDPSQCVEASLTIADCSRVVVLDFYAAKPADVTNALHKARALRDVVTDFTDALERADAQVHLS